MIVVIFAVFFAVAAPAASTAQPPAETGKTAKPRAENPALTRLKIFLDSLAQEARTVFPEERRPYAIVEVANTYWEVDPAASRLLFISAMDTALSLSRQDKKYRGLLNYVLSAATKRDLALAKELNKRLLDDEGDDISSEIALDLLEENPAAAAQMAEAFAPNGLKDGTAAFLIFDIAKKDIALSDRVYRAYLAKVGADENIPLQSVLTLGGYAFGYTEFYTTDKKGQLFGAVLVHIPELTARPVFTSGFLDLAARRIATAIDKREQAGGADIEAMNFSILFALEYLMPEVAKFAPNRLSAWQQLQQRGIVGTTAGQAQLVQSYMQRINQSRLKTPRVPDPARDPDAEAEARLENVEKLPGTCQRDVIYSKVALEFSYRKNFKRALEVAGKIEDLKQAEIVKDAISMNMVEAAIENGEFEDARTKAEKISSPEHKARLYVQLAQALAKKNDTVQAGAIVSEAVKLTEKLPNAADRAGIFFSLSAIPLKTDPIEAQSILRNAVKNLNKLEPADQMSYSIPIKVPLSCPGEEETWYGGFETLPNSTVFEAFALFAGQNTDQATGLADEIGDKITKIRSLAIITKVALVNLRVKPKNKLQGSGN
jgi:hypothetical protein